MSAAIELEQLRARLAALFPGYSVNASCSLWHLPDGREHAVWFATAQDARGVAYHSGALMPTAEAAFGSILADFAAKIDAVEAARLQVSEVTP